MAMERSLSGLDDDFVASASMGGAREEQGKKEKKEKKGAKEKKEKKEKKGAKEKKEKHGMSGDGDVHLPKKVKSKAAHRVLPSSPSSSPPPPSGGTAMQKSLVECRGCHTMVPSGSATYHRKRCEAFIALTVTSSPPSSSNTVSSPTVGTGMAPSALFNL